jgi:peptidyl-prolyl cis-trans isomerase B (cyclophilin B)
MIQGGCPNGDGLGSPGYSIPAELAERTDGELPSRLKHIPGRLSMARSGHYDSAGSQFFICVGDSKSLDGEYTVFGEVVRGMDVVDTIAETTTGARDKPLEDVTIDMIELLPNASN